MEMTCLTDRKAVEPLKVKFVVTIDYGKGKQVDRDCLSKRGMITQVNLGFSNPNVLGIYVTRKEK